MSARGPSVLWVTAEEPNVDLGGGNIRQANLLRALAANADVDLLLVGSLRDAVTRAALRRVIELPKPPRRDRSRIWLRRAEDLLVGLVGRHPFEARDEARARRLLRRRLREVLGHDVVIVEHAALAPLARSSARRRAGAAWVLSMQTIGSVRSLQAAAAATGARQRWLWRRDATRARRLERWAARSFDLVVTVSPDDATDLGHEAIVVPNGVDTDVFAPTPVPDEPRVVLTGTLSYLPNVDGSIWFCTEVWPLIRGAVPDAQLDIVGREPVPQVMRLSGTPGVEIHPDVPSVVPFLAQARVAVVPLRIGSGTRLKALEAMAAQRPLVGTSIGLAGLGLVDGTSARIAESAEAFAAAVVQVLTDDDLAKSIARRGHELSAAFSWRQVGEGFSTAVIALAGTAQPPSTACR